MAKNLVIVESPAKARTIRRYLGSDFQVMPSVGHVVDLPKSQLGVDIEHDFSPEYHVIAGKTKVLREIKAAARGKENIYLATDPDREGEAIAWHVAERLGRSTGRVHRVLLHEITQPAVREAVAHPRDLNRNLYEAQQARRVLDRLVGYQISPLLWDKVKRGISAGRVQSVALRLIVEREKEREAFRAEEYWTLDAELEAHVAPPFKARLFSYREERIDNKTRKLSEREAGSIRRAVEKVPFAVANLERKEVRRAPAAPFITSRLQQEAARKLYFAPSRTMRVAQRLYEGIELGEEGSVGLITYMRTDSPRVSSQALNGVRSYIEERFGKDYLPRVANRYRSAKSAQEAHEAIRPTSLSRDPDTVARYLPKDELRLYTLIFNRFVSSQMTPARFDRTTADIRAEDAVFRATGQVMKFDGFMRVYTEGQDEAPAEEGSTLPPLSEGERLQLLGLSADQHFTQPPPRFSQATLIKELEDKGIGRPSTYAAIMTSILGREYVSEDGAKRLVPTTLGRVVSDLLVEAFPDVVEVAFTAQLEQDLDKVEEGRQTRLTTLKRFYGPFEKRLGQAQKKMPEIRRKGFPTGLKCEIDGGEMVIKWGRNGDFLGCSNYPKCRNTKEFSRTEQGEIVTRAATAPEATDDTCEKCGKPMVRRRSRFGEFLGCSGYPECKNIKRQQRAAVKTGVKCPDCGEGDILERTSRRGKLFFGCSRYPKCKFASWDKVIPMACPSCGSGWTVAKVTRRDGMVRKCPNRECSFSEAMPDEEQAPSTAVAPTES